MGLFSSKTRTVVSSSVYNLAGDEDLRPDFLKSVIVSSILSDSKTSVGANLLSSLNSGSGAKQRQFYRWCRDNYVYGLPEASLDTRQDVSTAAVQAGMAAAIPLTAYQELRVSSAVIDDAVVDYWAVDWVVTNRPDLGEEDWTVDFDINTDELVIEIAGEADVRIPGPADMLWGFDRGLLDETRRILYVGYVVLTQDPDTLDVTAGPASLFTYRMGSGTVALDALVSASVPMDSFLPVVPLRLNNVSIREPQFSEDYVNITKAYKKLTGSSIEELLDQIEDNDQIGNIDYIYMVQGVSLNTKEKAGKAYLYSFFQDLMSKQESTAQDFFNYKSQVDGQIRSVVPWDRWTAAHDPALPGKEYHPYYAQPAPTVEQQAVSKPAINELRIFTEALPSFDYRVRWHYVDETQHIGNGKSFDGDITRGKLQVGDYWIHQAADFVSYVREMKYERGSLLSYITSNIYTPRIFIFKQYERYRYSRIEVVGLEHRNFVYGGHSVGLSSRDALDLADESSGFIIPLHYPTLKDMGLLKGTQLSTISSYLVFNSYDQYKQKWYQTGLFKIILVIASIALTVIFAPAGAAAASGILGTNLAVGTALGITSVMGATIAGAVANSVAAMIVTSLISKASVALFGEKWGAIIGTIASFVGMSYGMNYANTGTFDIDWSAMMRVENITKITNSVSNAYTQWINSDTMDIFDEMGRIKEEYADELDKISELSDEILGMTAGLIDPMMFTDTDEYLGESSETFLGRTLLTGSEIAELTHVMIENFSEISLELPKAIR